MPSNLPNSTICAIFQPSWLRELLRSRHCKQFRPFNLFLPASGAQANKSTQCGHLPIISSRIVPIWRIELPSPARQTLYPVQTRFGTYVRMGGGGKRTKRTFFPERLVEWRSYNEAVAHSTVPFEDFLADLSSLGAPIQETVKPAVNTSASRPRNLFLLSTTGQANVSTQCLLPSSPKNPGCTRRENKVGRSTNCKYN